MPGGGGAQSDDGLDGDSLLDGLDIPPLDTAMSRGAEMLCHQKTCDAEVVAVCAYLGSYGACTVFDAAVWVSAWCAGTVARGARPEDRAQPSELLAACMHARTQREARVQLFGHDPGHPVGVEDAAYSTTWMLMETAPCV